jgi:hypothetical protein
MRLPCFTRFQGRLLPERLRFRGGEVVAALLRQAQEIEASIERLNCERAEPATVHAEGLSGKEAVAIRTFAVEIRERLVHATVADQRRLDESRRRRGTIILDPEGARLGRYHTFRIECDGAVRRLHCLYRNLYRVMLCSSRLPHGAAFSIVPVAAD